MAGPLVTFCFAEGNKLKVEIQPAFCPFHSQLTQPVFSQLLHEAVIEEIVKGLTKVTVNNIHCSPFMHQTRYLILEGCQVT